MKRRFSQESYDWDLSKGSILNSPRFSKFSIENITIPASIKKVIVAYVENFEENFKEGKGLYLYSNTPGSGKTTVLAILLKHLMKMGYRVYCDSLVEMKSKLKKEFNNDFPQLLESMKSIELLAIDDIGSETMSNWLDEVFKEVLDHRYNMQKPILFTSNVEMSLLPFFNKSKDRLKEVSYTVKFPEKSFRKTLDNIF